MNSTNKVTIYGCGGMGVNLTSELAKAEDDMPGFASRVHCFIDTSKSNLLAKQVPEDRLYLFENVDGSGKVRAQNYEDIAKNALAILQKFKPTALNIVIHSAAGGSGSVIGPVLVSELKARGEQVIVILAGSTASRIEIENTIKTLKSYESIAHKRNSPVVTHYLENSAENNRTAVNKMVRSGVSLLCGLFSGQNEELDSADLKSWMEFLQFTGGEAQLSSLNFSFRDGDLAKVGTVASVATLALREVDTELSIPVAYQTVGFAPDTWRLGNPDGCQMLSDHPIHFAISSDFITSSVQRLNATLKDIDETFASRVARVSILDKGDTATSTGLVL